MIKYCIIILSLVCGNILSAISAAEDTGHSFDRDSLFERYARQGRMAVFEELTYYYDDVLTGLSREDLAEEGKEAVALIRATGNKRIFPEIGYLEALCLPDTTRQLADIRFAAFREVRRKASRHKDIEMEMRASVWLFRHHYSRGEYHDAFSMAHEIGKRLEELTDEQYPFRKQAYFYLGEAYYHFNDYDRAVPYLKKAVADSALYFFDRSNLQARNTLGVYYRDKNELEESDRWFRSMLTSPDRVKFRAMYDCIAISNLGGNLNRRGRYAEAIPLFRKALPVALAENDESFASGITCGLGEAYLALGDLVGTKNMIDSTRLFINVYNHTSRYRTLYPLMNCYYMRTGNDSLAAVYLDSTLIVTRQLVEQYNARHILRAEQDIFGNERRLKEHELRVQRLIARISVIACLIILMLLWIVVTLYRKNRRAYRELVRKSSEWAERVQGLTLKPQEADMEDQVVMEAICKLIEDGRVYRDPTLTLETLSAQVGFSRNAVSKAINTTQQKKFNAFINDYRICEAIRLLSDPGNGHLTGDAVATASGFNSRETFYRAFKTKTGVTPAQFRKWHSQS